MRTALIAAAGLAASLATAAHAAPATVDVTVGPALMAKAKASYGVRDVNDLALDLRKTVALRLARTGAHEGARVELVLVDAQPNHPTFQQLADTPGLSTLSVSIGGARVEGRIVDPDGHVTPVRYQYYSPTLLDVLTPVAWGDAEWTFQRLAYQLGRSQRLASR